MGVFFLSFLGHTHTKEQMEPGASYKTVARQTPRTRCAWMAANPEPRGQKHLFAPVTLTSHWGWDAFPDLPQVQEPWWAFPSPCLEKIIYFSYSYFLFVFLLVYISINQKALLYLLVLIPEEFPWRCRVGGYGYAAIALGGALLFVGRLRSWLSLFKCLQLLLSIEKDRQLQGWPKPRWTEHHGGESVQCLIAVTLQV